MRRIMKFWCAALALAFAMPAQAQWSRDPKENKQLTDERMLGHEIAHCTDGSFYVYYGQTTMSVLGEDTTSQINPFLQYFDINGNAVWPEPIQLADEPTLSYTKYMQHLLVDSDGNCVVAVQNMKNGKNETYTLFKVSRTGEMLWGEKGINLMDGESGWPGALNMIQMPDGSYMCAWMQVVDIFSNTFVQKISKDGKRMWGDGKDLGGGDYPHLVDAGDGDVIVVYAYAGITAKKLDMQGNDLWDKPVSIFKGSLPDIIPLWTYISVVPADGGVIVGYYAFDGQVMRYPMITWITANGQHVFPTGEAGFRIVYSDNWGFEPKLVYDSKEKAVYAVWRENAAGTNFVSRFCSQKISMDGELCWGEEGKALLPLKDRQVAYPTAALGPDGTVLFAFMESAGISAASPISVHAVLQKSDGSFVWDSETSLISNYESSKNSLYCSPFIKGNWFLIWEDSRVRGGVSDGDLWGQNIRLDGTLGADFVANELMVAEEFAEIGIVPNPVGERACIYVNSKNYNGSIVMNLLDMSGRKVAQVYEGSISTGENVCEWQRPAVLRPGLYVLEIKAGNNVLSRKVVLR